MKIFMFFAMTCQISFAQSTFYISSTGNNSNSGTTPSKPWKTIVEVIVGNTYLLKCNDTLYFNIALPKMDSLSNKRTLISSYGKGAKPILSLYKKILPWKFVEYSHNIWRVDMTDTNNYTGYINKDNNIGFLKINNTIFGDKKENISLLSKTWDFYSDDKMLYIFNNTNPSDSQISIFSTCNISAIKICDGMTISKIKIQGSGSHAISGLKSNNVEITEVEISEVGGSYLPGFRNNKVRYGNGIQFYNGGFNCLIKSCSISEVYDTAVTMQGDDKKTHFNGVVFKNNSMTKNEQSFEVWIKGGGPGFTFCKFIDNTCSKVGFGWSHKYRPIQYEAVHLLSYNLDCIYSDILIKGNTFRDAKSGLYFYLDGIDTPKFISQNNKIFLTAKTPIRSNKNTENKKDFLETSYTVKTSNQFTEITGKERGSVFHIIN